MPQWIREPSETYHATPNAWGSSLARLALASPRKARDRLDGIDASPTGAALGLGTAWHSRLTGVGDCGLVRPEGIDGRTKDGKAWLAEHADRLILTAEQAQALDLMAERIPRPIAARLAAWKAEGLAEVVARADRGSWAMQARLDFVCEHAGVLVDLKTTGKPLEDFARSALTYGYPFQAGWYRRVVAEFMGERQPRRWVLVVTETISPFRTVQFAPDSDWLAYGDAQAAEAADIIARCYESGDWSDHTQAEQPLALPKWAGSTTGATVPDFE